MNIIPCLLVISFVKIENSPIVVGLSRPRVYLDGLGEISDGLVILLFTFGIGKPPIEVSDSILRVSLNGFIKVVDGSIMKYGVRA